MKLVFSPSPVFPFSRFFILSVAATLLITQVSAQVVEIPDPNLEKAIRETLNIPNNNSITHQEMLRLTSLRIESPDLKYLTGLKHATNLEHLSLGEVGMVSDLTPLSNLTSLQRLNVAGNQISDIRPLAGLIHLRTLALWDNQLQNIAPLANLTALTYLDLSGNHVESFQPLIPLIHLRTLRLANSQIEDITLLQNLTSLVRLTVSHNQITHVSPLAGLINLTFLNLRNNRISDLNPLANLTALETLRLDINAITDITPLTGLKNLKELRIADNPIHDFTPLAELEGVELDIEIDFNKLDQLNLIVKVPDPNLRQLIRDALSLPDGESLTQGQMLQLTRLDTDGNRGITDLTGIEYATNLRWLSLDHNPIADISPLASLTKLKTLNLSICEIVDLNPLRNLKNLTIIFLGFNQISDISPLAGLTNLTDLDLESNQISDISPLAELTNLTNLELCRNLIIDFSSLANLNNLRQLWIEHNPGDDFSPLQGLNLTNFRYDVVCDFPPYPLVQERIANRSFPSVFAAWGGLGWSPVVNRQDLSDTEQLALHDFHWSPRFSVTWDRTPTEPSYGLATQLAGNLDRSREQRQQRLQLNPNMVFIAHLLIHGHSNLNIYPPDSDFWLKDAQNQIIKNKSDQYLINFLKPEVQDLIVKRIVAVERCGLYDGVFIDGFNKNGMGFIGRNSHPVTDEEIIQVLLKIFRAVRAQTRDDFLIIVNANDSKPTRFTELINGTFMETGKDHPGGYTYDSLRNLESVLLWAEENLREPQITCLEGAGMSIEPPDGPNNRRWMRAFTTMSLTHSDGYVLYTDGQRDLGTGDHLHLWHDFWDTDLGYPVGGKAQPYQGIEGTFIREFTNGWAVYNRSGTAQTITLPASATPVSDRGNNAASQTHLLPDLDGEIYLKGPTPADVNGDGRINILDVLQVANNLGQTAPDPNGDGVVDILDLVFVAQQFSQ